MLLEFSCENFRSIKDKITISMVATIDDELEDELRPFEKIRVSRLASIYGANGSGKSTIIGAINFLKALVINSVNHQPGDKINRPPHKLNLPDVPTSLSCQFIKSGVRYAYGVSWTADDVTDEYLYHFKKGRQAKVFDRRGMNVVPGETYKKACELAQTILKENRLFLSCAANFSAVEEIESAFLFFKEDIVVYGDFTNNWLDYSARVLGSNPEVKSIFLKFLQSTGSDIVDIRTKVEQKRFDSTELPPNMPEAFKALFTGQDTSVIEAKLQYKQFILDLQEESSGTKKLFEILCPLIEIILKDQILLWDELESSLHPCIVKEILNLFKSGISGSRSQLIFTTHDINLLDLSYFRRDQIWFTELDETNRSTDLYSLFELKNVRKDENILKGYISGKYGAIPCLNVDLADIINKR